MKKIVNIFMAVSVALLWIFFFSGFSRTGTISKIICIIILVPFTAKVFYGFLLEHSHNKEMSKDNMANNFTPFSPPDSGTSKEDVCFCTECGAKNQKGTNFCINCGKALK